MRYTLDHDVDRYYRLAVNVLALPKVVTKEIIKGIDKLTKFYQEIGMPTTFNEIGASEKTSLFY